MFNKNDYVFRCYNFYSSRFRMENYLNYTLTRYLNNKFINNWYFKWRNIDLVVNYIKTNKKSNARFLAKLEENKPTGDKPKDR